MSTERKQLLDLSLEHDLISITVCYALLRCFNENNPLRLSSGFQCTRLFNLHALDIKIMIKKDETSRYCFLLDYLSINYLKLPKDFIKRHKDEEEPFKDFHERYRKEWISMMLEVANISNDHFKSHYRDALHSETKKNVSFRENLEKFENIISYMS